MSIFTLRHRNEKGQALVEFTLMFPIFLAVFIGLMGVSLIFYSYITLQLAVREGTNAIVHDPQGQTIQSITNLVKAKTFSFNPNAITVVIYPDDTTVADTAPQPGWTVDRPISIQATYTVPFPTVNMALPGGATLRLGPIPISATSKMTIE